MSGGMLGTTLTPEEIWASMKGIGRGINLGGTAGMLGGPVDLATALMRPFGYNVDAPVMSSKWIEQKLQPSGLLPQRQGGADEFAGEMASIFLNPAMAAQKLGPALYRAESQAAQNLSTPRTLNNQAGMIELPFGRIPENIDDLKALENQAWFSPVEMTKKNLSPKKSQAAKNATIESYLKWFGQNVTPQNATEKQLRRAQDELNRRISKDPKRYLENVEISSKDQEKQYLKAVLEQFPGLKNQVHKNEQLAFQSMPINNFDGAQIYKSPSYNGRQSSEYKLVMNDGVPAYARKSDHFGKFTTNIYEGSDDAIRLGLTNESFDPFGRVGFKGHNWQLLGDTTTTKSKAGFIPMPELLQLGLLGFK